MGSIQYALSCLFLLDTTAFRR